MKQTQRMPSLFGSNRVIGAALAVLAAIVLIGHPARSEERAPSSQEERHREQERHRYEVITEGLLGNPAFSVQFRSAALRLGVRDLIMGPGQAQSVPTHVRTLMELRGGGVVTIINDESQQRLPGDFWIVEQGSTLSLQNDGDVAVIRAIQLFEGR
jgi:hypothetical protein